MAPSIQSQGNGPRPSIDRLLSTIVIDEMLKRYPDEYQDEPLTLAHELGHHFDWIRGEVPSLTDDERERRADEYMVRLADKHSVGDRARALANYHRPGSYIKREE